MKLYLDDIRNPLAIINKRMDSVFSQRFSTYS